jgi:hypothetical protein
MMPLDPQGTPGPRPVHVEPRIGGAIRTVEEEEELQLALTILRMQQRLHSAPRGSR